MPMDARPVILGWILGIGGVGVSYCIAEAQRVEFSPELFLFFFANDFLNTLLTGSIRPMTFSRHWLLCAFYGYAKKKKVLFWTVWSFNRFSNTLLLLV
jgi:hypothetical protein